MLQQSHSVHHGSPKQNGFVYRVDVGIMGRLLLWVKHFLGHHKTCGSNYSVLRLSFIMEW